MDSVRKAKYSINDLPSFSPWPARLLNLEPWEKKTKTPQEIVREYENEKWGRLLAKVQKIEREVSVGEVDEWVLKDISDSLCSIEGKVELLSAIEAHQRYKKLVKQVIRPYLPATALVELGAGYGSVILSLAKQNRFSHIPIMAGEFTDSGIELIKRLSKAKGLKIVVGHCDIASSEIVDFVIPENAIIFTSYTIPCVPKLSSGFVKALLKLNPKAVIHIDPCYEHCDNTSLLGLLRRRYIEVNGYNTNLVTLLHSQQDMGCIKILEERPAVFGMNPLLPVSVIAWKPSDAE